MTDLFRIMCGRSCRWLRQSLPLAAAFLACGRFCLRQMLPLVRDNEFWAGNTELETVAGQRAICAAAAFSADQARALEDLDVRPHCAYRLPCHLRD